MLSQSTYPTMRESLNMSPAQDKSFSLKQPKRRQTIRDEKVTRHAVLFICANCAGLSRGRRTADLVI